MAYFAEFHYMICMGNQEKEFIKTNSVPKTQQIPQKSRSDIGRIFGLQKRKGLLKMRPISDLGNKKVPIAGQPGCKI